MSYENIYALKIFHGFDTKVVDKIVSNLENRKYNAGETIVVEGEKGNGEGYIIKKGIVSISIGGKQIVSLYEGDIFGEIALLNEEDRTATVKAETDLEVIVLNMASMIEIINNDSNQLNKTILKRIEENIERED